LFGSKDKLRVIHDSRQLKDLAAVLSDSTGSALSELRANRDLAEALSTLGQPDSQVLRALALASKHLQRAVDSVHPPLSPDARAALDAINVLVKRLETATGEGS
jgi:hypothetical protein